MKKVSQFSFGEYDAQVAFKRIPAIPITTQNAELSLDVLTVVGFIPEETRTQ
ncbi:MAG: hypothetical protein AAFN77_09975 [Planctomycetota bacterium]